MQIHLSALGCRLNEAELEGWSVDFQQMGHCIVPDPADADILVLNTCAVTQEAVRKSRKSIQQLHRQNPNAKLIVSGCYATLTSTAERQSLQTELGVDLIVSNQEKNQLAALAQETLGAKTMPEAATDPHASSLFQRNRQRAFIKIQDGCRYRCTFCIVTVARGEERSRPIRDIVAQINQLHAGGVQEIVLTGVHVGGYGTDLNTNLYSLVEAILSDTDMPRIRFASVEPWDLPDSFFTLFQNPRLMQHMHLPLQSGSDSVLRRMGRRCKTRDFSALLRQIRSTLPDFNVTTDIIVGFPGETDAEWQESVRYIESIGFGHIHCFSYSVREGTKAARLPNQIHRSIKRQRSKVLHTIAASSKREVLKTVIGQQVEVLWETEKLIDGEPHYFGYTPNYLRVITPRGAHEDLANAITRTHLSGINEVGDCLTGTNLETVSQPQPQAATNTVIEIKAETADPTRWPAQPTAQSPAGRNCPTPVVVHQTAPIMHQPDS